jgi:replication protein
MTEAAELAGFFAGYDDAARRVRKGLEPLTPPPSLPESEHAAWYRYVASLEAKDRAWQREREQRRAELEAERQRADAELEQWERATFFSGEPVADYLAGLAGDALERRPSTANAVAAAIAEAGPLQGLTRGELEAAFVRAEGATDRAAPPRPEAGLVVDTELRETLDRVEGYERRFADRADLLRAVQTMPALRGHRVGVCLRYMAEHRPRRVTMDAGANVRPDPLAELGAPERAATVQVVGRRSRVAPDLDRLPIPPSLANQARFRGVAVCGSGWVCPMCASRITEGRRRELERAVDKHRAAGGAVLLVTQTFSHGRSDELAAAWDSLGRARQRFARSSAVKKFRELVGFVGRVACREVTYGVNGWHPHAHELVFVAGGITAERVAELERELAAQWRADCAAVGLEASLEHGFKMSLTAASAYVAKWGLDFELAKWQLKRGRVLDGAAGEAALAGLTPFDLLRIYARVMPGEPRLNLSPARAGHLFAEYAEAVVGTAQLHWTRGLKAKLEVTELTDSELAERDEADDVLLGTLTAHEWFVLVHRRNQVEFLGLVAAQGWDAARVFLTAWVEDFDQRGAAHVRRLLYEQRRAAQLRGNYGKARAARRRDTSRGVLRAVPLREARAAGAGRDA